MQSLRMHSLHTHSLHPPPRSKKSDGSLRTLRALASGKDEGQPFYDQYARYFKVGGCD